MWKKSRTLSIRSWLWKIGISPKKNEKRPGAFKKKPSKRDIEDKRWDRYCYLDDESAFRYFMICLWIYLYTYLWSYVTRISPYMSRCMVLFFEKKICGFWMKNQSMGDPQMLHWTWYLKEARARLLWCLNQQVWFFGKTLPFLQWSNSNPIPCMGLVYLPTWMVDMYGKCR